jgi:uncharacterized protein (TIGR02996 family)
LAVALAVCASVVLFYGLLAAGMNLGCIIFNWLWGRRRPPGNKLVEGPMTEDDFLQAIAADPGSAAGASAWLALAHWLKKHRQPERAELVRLQHDRGWRPESSVASKDARVRELLATGVAPVVPSLVNSVGMRFVLVPAGTFVMGSSEAEEERDEDEGPQHRVTLTRPFWIGAFTVTQQEYKGIMGTNPSRFWKKGSKSPDRGRFPVDRVSWNDAVAFCERLSGLPAESQLFAWRCVRAWGKSSWCP